MNEDGRNAELGLIPTHRKTGAEPFSANGKETGATLLGFWQWAVSDLLDNTERGILAEYLVALDFGVADGVRSGWDAFDLTTKSGVRVEVKSASYVQGWNQKDYSKIIFGIQPTHAWDPETNQLGEEKRRHSDFYVFCLLAHKDQWTIDPMNVDQWRFFLVPTAELDKAIPDQKTIGLSALQGMGAREVNWGRIGRTIHDLAEASGQALDGRDHKSV